MSAQLQAALIRGLIAAVIGALVSFGTLYGAQADQHIVVAGVIAAFTAPLLVRGFGEGSYDANRAAAGHVLPSDVTATATKS